MSESKVEHMSIRKGLLLLITIPASLYIVYTGIALTGVGKRLIAWGEAHHKDSETFPQSWSEADKDPETEE